MERNDRIREPRRQSDRNAIVNFMPSAAGRVARQVRNARFSLIRFVLPNFWHGAIVETTAFCFTPDVGCWSV